ncbi:MAG: dipicolinate synthase subunit B [Ruminococcaceae bacterium]|nr:dipicolinate synthase subunit B [Oscillospiraceae bacterium]MBE6705965.1 dipicolinate synthase subunit B [Oscillospiraceae bacterium]
MRKKLGFAICGSFCTHSEAIKVMKELSEEYDIVPILSYISSETDTRFGTAEELKAKIKEISGREAVNTIAEAEKFGPSSPLDSMIICPCTGNTLAKLANGITDTPVTMAAKAHLRSDRPLLVALASNDAMSGNFINIGKLLNRKNVYFVPMKQDDTVKKPHSLVADFSCCREGVNAVREGKQIRPLFT